MTYPSELVIVSMSKHLNNFDSGDHACEAQCGSRSSRITASDCVVRIAGTVRVDEEQFEQRLRSGALCQPRGRKRDLPDEPTSRKKPVSPMAEDNFTTVAEGPATKHRRTGETGCVQPNHPFSPEMIRTAR